MRKGSGRWVFGRCSHLGLHMAGCAMKQVISRYVGVGTRLFVTCLRESVENDGPDMEGPRQRGETVIAGETESRQEGLGWACIVWQYMEPLAVGIDMRRSSSLGAERKDSGELRMGDGGGRASNHPGWTRFSTRRLVTVGASIPAIRLARNIQCIIIIARSILYIPLHDVFDPRWLRGFHLHGRHRGSPRPYTSSHRSSNALIIKPETCPKNFAEMATCRGFAKAKMISYLTRVDSFPSEAFTTGSNLQVVSRVLNRGVEDDATAL